MWPEMLFLNSRGKQSCICRSACRPRLSASPTHYPGWEIIASQFKTLVPVLETGPNQWQILNFPDVCDGRRLGPGQTKTFH